MLVNDISESEFAQNLDDIWQLNENDSVQMFSDHLANHRHEIGCPVIVFKSHLTNDNISIPIGKFLGIKIFDVDTFPFA